MAFDEAEREFLDVRIIQPIGQILVHQATQNGGIRAALKGTEINARAVIEIEKALEIQLKDAVAVLPCAKRDEQLNALALKMATLADATQRHDVNWGRILTWVLGAIAFLIQTGLLIQFGEALKALRIAP